MDNNMMNRCPVCDKIFAIKGSVKRHLKEFHGIRKPVDNRSNKKRVPCEYCNKTFFDKSTLNKHLRSVHKKEKIQEKSTLNAINKSGLLNKCLGCSKEFDGIKDLLHHLTTKHNFIEDCLEENFSNLEEFYIWLTQIEEENKFKYILKRGTCINKNYSRLYYECNRSGMKPESIVNRKRCQKSQGSQKIGVRCTSHLVVKVNKMTNAVHVKYWKTHYGHDIEIQHIRIPESARKNIAGKLLLGDSAPKIIDSIRDGIGDSYQKLKRVDIITRMDIYNIKRSFKIDIRDGVRHTDDATSVSPWVQENLQEQIESCLKRDKNIEGKKQNLQEQIISTALEVITLASNPVSSEVLSSAYKHLNIAKSLLQLAEVPNTNDFKIQNPIITQATKKLGNK